MSENIVTLDKNEASRSLKTLADRLNRVEGELDLECTNLRGLVKSKDPQINEQLDSLSRSISELHESLAEVRTLLGGLPCDNAEVAAATQEAVQRPTKRPKEDLGLTAQQIGRQRHDEKVTLSGIFRALLMADEPEQRAHYRNTHQD
ncbi:hypothetical protein [Roseibacillus ishigakijimensis]|uniref:Uncharacterized protein n=1 Tax=Roseibacillus ishigakijimensis TaxID=454146 RepID=A0A934RPN2_9BACT|nr:hypothetical protein [Roseibacillus ishigakijimensis]MBK1835184.1 hypothetical protein [Roseibacillus ishigakijimensis]